MFIWPDVLQTMINVEREMTRYHRKKNDLNQKTIVEKLRKLPGVGVQVDHDDILVGYQGRTYWFEVKNPDKVTKDGKIQRQGPKSMTQQKQEALEMLWPGHYQIVWTLEQILEAIGYVRNENL